MKKAKPINAKRLLTEAKTAEHKEVYKLLERNEVFRVGVGARANSPEDSPFFVEVNIKLSPGSDEVNLPKMAKTMKCLNELQSRGYALTNQDGNCISCEKNEDPKNLAEESATIVSFLRSNLRKQK